MKWLGEAAFAIALRLVPAEWRDTVESDLEEEAATAEHGVLWCVWFAIGAAIRLRTELMGDTVITEFRNAVRSLFRAKRFALGAIATFALGIGVNVAVFSAVDRALFRPLPYARPNELVMMGAYAAGASRPYGTLPMTYVAKARTLDAIADASQSGWNLAPFTVSEEPDDEPALLLSEASYNALSVLGVRPVTGRDFSEADARDRHSVALISHEAWRGRFAGRAVSGMRIWNNRQPTEIVGVLPPGFINASNSLDPRSDGLMLDFVDFADEKARAVPATVRLKPGVPLSVAQSQVDAMVAALPATEPPLPPGRVPTEIRLVPVRDVLFGGYAQYLWLITASAALVFLVATANLSSLMLVRGRSRAQEHAVRASLGASRRRLTLASMVEGLVLSISGSAVALVVLWLTNTALQQTLPLVFSRYAVALTDWRVLAVVVSFATVGALAAGIAPGLRAGRVDVLAILQEGGRGSSRRAGGRSLLVVETAATLLFVAGAVATGRNLVALERTDLGFTAHALYGVRVSLIPLAPPNPAADFASYSRVGDAVASMPNVSAFGAVNEPPFYGSRPEPMTKALGVRGMRHRVGAGYLETIGARVIAGRLMTHEEVDARRPVGVLSESGVALAFPNTSPADAIGRQLPSEGESPFEIIGVVADIQSSASSQPDPLLYVPLDDTRFRFMEFAVRTTDGRKPSMVEIRQRVKAAGLQPRSVTVTDIGEGVGKGLSNFRFRAVLFASFAVVALLLAAVGLYSVASYEVAQRRRELGVRLALGATPQGLIQDVIQEAVRPVFIGVAIGLVAAYWAARFLQTFLAGVDARDPLTLSLVAALLIGVAAAAGWLPARRAAKTNPSEVLRGL